MENIDAIRINFNPDQLLLLNICLAILMFGVALDIRVSDFRRIFDKPKAPIVGLTSQLILLPILTLLMIYIFVPPVSLAIGMVLVGVCPGGNTSNFMVHLAKANAALSVMMTSIVTLGASVITPFAFYFWLGFVSGTENLEQDISVPFWDMVWTIITLIVIPLSIGMWMNHRLPKVTQMISKPVRWFSLVIFFSFVIFAIAGNYDNIVNYLGIVFWIVIIHNGLALALGYYFSRLNGLVVDDARAVSIETGIQNTGLALILIFNFFNGLGGMALIAAWWGIWHLISGFGLAMYWKDR